MVKPLQTDPDWDEARAVDAPLARRLERYAELLRESFPDAATAYDDLVDSLLAADAGANAPKPGDVLPPFALPDDRGGLATLERFVSRGPVIVSLNRGHWCGFCRLELTALEEIYPTVREHGAEIVSITPDTATYTRRLKHTFGLRFSILTDLDNSYALELGLVIPLPAALRSLYLKIGIDLAMSQRSDAWMLPIPATFLVDRDAVIRDAYVDPDFRRRMDPARLIDGLTSLASSPSRPA